MKEPASAVKEELRKVVSLFPTNFRRLFWDMNGKTNLFFCQENEGVGGNLVKVVPGQKLYGRHLEFIIFRGALLNVLLPGPHIECISLNILLV